jgi:virulence-associated protein VagC
MPERARIFTNGGSQAVELPESCRFPEGENEVLVHREGNRLILEPVTPVEWVNGWSPEFLAVLGSLKDEEIPLPPQRPITEAKDPFK